MQGLQLEGRGSSYTRLLNLQKTGLQPLSLGTCIAKDPLCSAKRRCKLASSPTQAPASSLTSHQYVML